MHRIGRSGILCVMVGLAACASGQAKDRDGDKLKAQLQGTVRDGWEVTDFKAGDKETRPWGEFFPTVSKGYAASFEQMTQSVAESSSKHGGSNAMRHPRFFLWIMDRSQLDEKSFEEAMRERMMMQSAHPVFLGLTRQFFVTCIYDCSLTGEQMQRVLKTLKVTPPVPKP